MRERIAARLCRSKGAWRWRARRLDAMLRAFNRESEKYREEVLPKSCRKRVAIEAGITEIWYQYVGLDGKVVGLHQFGLSAPGAEVMKERGIDAKHVVEAARSL